MAPRRLKEGLLARVNFPLYSVEMLTSRHILVAGGGGSSNTGVANGFEIYEIYHNGQNFVAEEVMRHETGANVVMNCAVRNKGNHSYLVAGQESHCQLYHVKVMIENFDTVPENGRIETLKPLLGRKNSATPDERNVRNRKASRDSSVNRKFTKPKADSTFDSNKNENRCIRFEIKAGDLTQTDFTNDDPFQRVVRICLNCEYMATGGTDAHVRIWKFPNMVQIFNIKAHSKEIDDLHFSPDSKQLVSIAKDGLGIIWNVKTGKECAKLNWTQPNNVKYLFKRCRFGVFEGKLNQYRLFTIANPLRRVGKQVSYLQEWNPQNGALTNSVAINETLAALAVRDDGRFVAIGTMSTGSVSIYIAFSLQRVLHIPSAHSQFVTGLEFLPENTIDGPPITSTSEAAVISISVDNKICIHSLAYRHTMPPWLAILLIVSALFFTFALCSYIGL